jgi:hypothetical protein
MFEDNDEDLRKQVIEGLDRVLHELGEIDRALAGADRAADGGMIREARRRTLLLTDETQGFFTWATETRLNPPPN